MTKTDENETYGDYYDPDQRMEVEDTNAYYSSDYEAGTSVILETFLSELGQGSTRQCRGQTGQCTPQNWINVFPGEHMV